MSLVTPLVIHAKAKSVLMMPPVSLSYSVGRDIPCTLRRRNEQALFKSGHPEMATLIYEISLGDPPLEELTHEARAPFDRHNGKLDLHNLTVSMSL